MPYQIKNGIVYGSNAVSLTQAQYDALSTAEKNNGTVYYIYDSEAVLDASDVSLGSGTVEGLAGSVAVIETSPTTATHAVGSYIVYNGQLYEVTAAIAVGETLTVGTNISATTVGAELTSLNNGLRSIQTLGNFIGYKDRTINNVSIPYDNYYASIGDIYIDWNLPAGAYLTSLYIRGWSGAPGLISLVTSSDGRGVYVYCTKAGTISSLVVRIWYAKF